VHKHASPTFETDAETEDNPMTATRSINGIEVPAAGLWTVDPGHAEVGFVGRHFGLTKVRGRFTGVDATVVIADEITASSVEVVIDMASVSSGDQSRDDHLRSAEFFDVDHHPLATFRSAGVVTNGSSGSIAGELTIRGVTRPVTLDVDYLGHATDPWGGERAVFSASATINREQWGLTWNMLLEAGGLLVSKEIRLEIEVELVRQDA
jgi:polyisoprenoid-binding protein YceI